MFAAVAANIVQKSTTVGNFGMPLEFSQYNCAAFQVWWSGITGTGKFQLQVSVPMNPLETDWVDKIGGLIETTGATGTDIRVVSNIGEKNVRIKWTPTGGVAGTVTAVVMGKDSSGPGNFTDEFPLDVTASFSGLRVGGRITEVTLNATTWTALPTTALSGRNALAMQNRSGIEMKINYNSSQVGYVGIVIADNSERQYDIKETVTIYGKSASGTPIMFVEEIA
jgi:hypothetical protein